MNTKEENDYKTQKQLIRIIFNAALFPPESFANSAPMRYMVLEIKKIEDKLRSVEQTLQDVMQVWGQVYQEVQIAPIKMTKDYQIVMYDDRHVKLLQPMEPPDDTSNELAPGY